jgi:general secretion pathway protein G
MAGGPACGFTAIEIMIAVAIVGILVAIALPAYDEYIERTRIFKATVDVGGIGTLVSKYAHDNDVLPPSLAEVGSNTMRDPWGNPYQYVNHDDPGTRGRWRKDKNIVPINTDFDVFSMGKDGASVPPLTAKASRDDIVRANNGRFVGLASDYDP